MKDNKVGAEELHHILDELLSELTSISAKAMHLSHYVSQRIAKIRNVTVDTENDNRIGMSDRRLWDRRKNAVGDRRQNTSDRREIDKRRK